MAEYLSPGVYIEDNPSPPIIEAVSSSTGGFVGITQRGKVGVPAFITSWNTYIKTFAQGMDSPFMANSDLAYAVYGFFQNGGQRCYIMRVASHTVATANMSYPDTDPTLFMEAKDEGDWGNKLKVTVTENEDNEDNFDLQVILNDTVVEVFTNLTNDLDLENTWFDVLETQSVYIEGSGDLDIITNVAFSGGADGMTDIADTDFTTALTNFDTIDDINLLCIPGQTSNVMNNALMSYCENRKDVFAILDGPKTSTVLSIKELRKGMSCKNADLMYPWLKVSDPLNRTGKLRDCPTAGHVMGVVARTITDRGVWKAPAGTEATVRGAIDLMTIVTKGEQDILNPNNINVIMPRPNYGIVIWGARTLHPDSSMKYVSDVLLDIMIKKSIYRGTQQFVFEPHDSKLWTKVTTTIEAFLDNLWRDGALFGDTPKEAYYVKCDEDLNPKNVRNAGKLVCEIGYASKKPAEFVIFRFSHEVPTA